MGIIKVAVVDDHKIVLQGIKSLLIGSDSIEIVGSYTSADQFLENMNNLNPDVLLLDMNLPGLSGAELCASLRDNGSEISVIMLTAMNTKESVELAIKSGAKGFLTKDVEKSELIHAISKVAQNEAYFGREVSDIVFGAYVSGIESSTNIDLEISKREIDVLKLVAEGLPHKLIADRLNISIKTVEAHKSNLQKKLNLQGTAELVKYAIKNGYVKL